MGGILDALNRTKDNEPKKFAIFMNNGDILVVEALSYSWDSDGTVCFYDMVDFDDDNANMIATFKQDILYGVCECDYEVRKKILALPKYDGEDSEDPNMDNDY